MNDPHRRYADLRSLRVSLRRQIEILENGLRTGTAGDLFDGRNRLRDLQTTLASTQTDWERLSVLLGKRLINTAPVKLGQAARTAPARPVQLRSSMPYMTRMLGR